MFRWVKGENKDVALPIEEGIIDKIASNSKNEKLN